MLKEREVRTLLEDCEPVALVTLEALWDDVAREAVAGTSVRIVVTDAQVRRARARHTPARRRRTPGWDPTTSPS